MIPLAARISIQSKRRSGLIGVPLFLVWLLLLPLALLLSPVPFIACLVGRVNPLRAFSIVWEIFSALRGTHVEVAARDQEILIDIP
jgi:hypothetical protein